MGVPEFGSEVRRPVAQQLGVGGVLLEVEALRVNYGDRLTGVLENLAIQIPVQLRLRTRTFIPLLCRCLGGHSFAAYLGQRHFRTGDSGQNE